MRARASEQTKKKEREILIQNFFSQKPGNRLFRSFGCTVQGYNFCLLMVNWLHYNSVPTEVHPENTTWQDLNLQNIYKDSSLLHKELLMHVVWFVKSELIHGVLRIHLSDNVRHSYFSYSVVSDYLRPHGLQHARLPCPSLTPGTYSNSCPSRQWCHATISSSVVPFFSHLLSFPESGSFQMSQSFEIV